MSDHCQQTSESIIMGLLVPQVGLWVQESEILVLTTHTWLVGEACIFVSHRALHRLCSGYVSEPN